jgi:hypothetical protein
MKSLKALVKQSQILYGKTRATRSIRHQWVTKTSELMNRGIHLKQTGKFPGKIHAEAETI